MPATRGRSIRPIDATPFPSTFLRSSNRKIVRRGCDREMRRGAVEEKEILKKDRGFVQSNGFFLIYSVQRIPLAPPPPLKKVIFQAVFLGEERVTVD